MEWESRFTPEPKAAKNFDFIEKCFKLKSFVIKLTKKNSTDDISIYLRSSATGFQKICLS